MDINKTKCRILFISFCFLACCILISGQTKELPPWEKGFMDIHHISTGRGNSTFLVFPNGTSMVIDCGDMSETQPRVLSERNTPIVPDNSKTPAQWVADYIYQFHPKGRKATIDYVLITHFHDDHFGQTDSLKKVHKEGKYILTGITELGSIIPVKKIIDRGYDFPVDFKDTEIQQKLLLKGDPYSMVETLQAYWKFIDFQAERQGLVYEQFKVGSSDQFRLISYPEQYPCFMIKNLFANGEVISTAKEGTYRYIRSGEYSGENELSTGIKISYGNFDYYTGGDISGIDRLGQNDPNSMEAKVAPVIGPVEVATLNHHGNRNSMNSFFVTCLRPQVWIQQTWSADHPGAEVLRRITSKDLYPGERDLFTNALLKANRIVLGNSVEKLYKSLSGHILVRVYPGGDAFSVFILDDKSSRREVKAQYDYVSEISR